MITLGKAVDKTKRAYCQNAWHSVGHLCENCQQLFRACEACDGKGGHYDAGEGTEDWCEKCLRSGQAHIDLPIEQLERLTQLMGVVKPVKEAISSPKLYKQFLRGYTQAQQEIKTLIL